LAISSERTVGFPEFETNQWLSTEVIENRLNKEVARPERVELSTFWFVAVGMGNLSASFGVAYGLSGLRFRAAEDRIGNF
jgi:hypothetical protein